MKKVNYVKSNSGITLTALIVTVIVLIILAGASINMLSGEDGVLKQAGEIANKSTEESIKEEIQFAITQAKMEYTGKVEEVENEKNFVLEYLNNYQTASGAYLTYDGDGIIYQKDGQISFAKVNLDNGLIESVFANTTATTMQEYNSQHPELHIPTGFQYKEGSVNEGYVIADSEGNEFVWIPVSSGDDYVKKIGTYNYGMTLENAGWQIGGTVEQSVRGEALGVSKILGHNVKSDIQVNQPALEGVAEENDMIMTLDNNQLEKKVINLAGGFWVGRYEAGTPNADHNAIAGIEVWTNSNEEFQAANSYWDNKTITVKPNQEPVRMITQLKALKLANNWKSGEADRDKGTVAFQSGLMTGSRMGYNV